MATSTNSSDAYRGSSASSISTGFSMLMPSNILRAPLSTLLDYSGLLRTRSDANHEFESFITRGIWDSLPDGSSAAAASNGEVAIRIMGSVEQGAGRESSPAVVVGQGRDVTGHDELSLQSYENVSMAGREGLAAQSSPSALGDAAPGDGSVVAGAGDSSYQRYDIQQAATWIEQLLPFSLLLLIVFIRQHLQGFFVTIWIFVVMYKSNDILRNQTALKGERKISVLIGISLAFFLQVISVYWWFCSDDLLQAAMVLKCFLLIYYKNSIGRNYRKQAQMLTVVEYLMLLYRALLPTTVWYRFFLNKEYSSLFSSLMTGLYLTCKLTSVVEKVQSSLAAVKALSRKDVHYGAYATSEQVDAAGDLCAICQEKTHAPILLSCKHIFCEDCVSEWFERERTCPLCRALVKPADIRSFSDGSTSLFFQIF